MSDEHILSCNARWHRRFGKRLCDCSCHRLAGCPNRARHWFTVYGMVGLRRPDCARCHAPNPKFTVEDRIYWEMYAKDPLYRARMGIRDA